MHGQTILQKKNNNLFLINCIKFSYVYVQPKLTSYRLHQTLVHSKTTIKSVVQKLHKPVM